MTESDFEQIRLIVTDAVAAAEKRLSDGQTRAVVELDRRIAELERRLIERQTARLHILEVTRDEVKIRLEALEERILNLETRRPNVPPAA